MDGRGTSDGVAARGFVNGRGPRLRRGRDSTDRCVPARSPSAADHERACLLQSQKKTKGPKSPTQRSGALNYPCFYKIKVSKTRCQKYEIFLKCRQTLRFRSSIFTSSTIQLSKGTNWAGYRSCFLFARWQRTSVC